ncbi:signal transduction histidine kinase [Kribbella orskensis]|uniref:histidine kinase n=1 Tax=Kribbella orskensis TaxID=2512216 RepID=A0ABY2BVN5_9ACTN|nr:histidine kinase [Kribbella orskensis]TCO32325.1 signal transduction histidine kinase [Kribbella orskensis]
METQAPTTQPEAPASPPAVPRRPRLWAEALFLTVVLVVMLTTATVREGHAEFPSATLLAFTVVAWLPLLLRTRWPLAALAGVVTAESLHLILVPYIDPGLTLTAPLAMGAYQPVPLATMVAAWTVAARRPRRIGWPAGLGAAVVLFAVAVIARPLALLATDLVMFQLVVIATAAGSLVTARRERREQAERERRTEIRQHIVDERLRIARDLHDTLAHHLTVVNAQAGVANHLLSTNPTAAATALTDITKHTMRALDELRATIGLLRYDTDFGNRAADTSDGLRPVPGLDRLDELLAGSRSAGVDLSLTVVGTPLQLPGSVDVAAYRIVQEALTNVAKHAPGATAEVTLTWSPTQLDLEIRNSPTVDRHRTESAPGTGHGLIGMRERAHACGGDVTTQPRPDGGYLVHATLPAAGRATSPVSRSTPKR